MFSVIWAMAGCWALCRLIEACFQAGAKFGLAPLHEYVVGSISVTADWLRRELPRITNRNNLRVIEAYGDSMQPTMGSGDLLVVDSGVNHADVSGIYILRRNNTPEPEVMVKRVQLMRDGGLTIKSDNPVYEPEKVPHDEAHQVEVLGRVVWVWAGKKIY